MVGHGAPLAAPTPAKSKLLSTWRVAGHGCCLGLGQGCFVDLGCGRGAWNKRLKYRLEYTRAGGIGPEAWLLGGIMLELCAMRIVPGAMVLARATRLRWLR